MLLLPGERLALSLSRNCHTRGLGLKALRKLAATKTPMGGKDGTWTWTER